ncbi:MAG: MBL fold metallo-hydrolase [Candidatus Bipolaricaulota bacterium]
MVEQTFETDTLGTATAEIEITFLGHGSLMFRQQGMTVYVDPYQKVADYAALPKADLVLITHEHRDHLDPEALAHVRQESTEVIHSVLCAAQIRGGTLMRNGDVTVVRGLRVEAIPAYNVVHRRDGGDPFHPCGNGNGYIITFGNLRVLVAGDTENTPELKAVRDIDVAFLPMNLPYTMTPEMVADVALAMRPKILYPYHYGSTDPQDLVKRLKDHPEIEVRVRRLA